MCCVWLIMNGMEQKSSLLQRVYSVDVFRALTMLLMIFVNDLWTISGYPHWLDHSAYDQDFLGLADLVFPCFLFAVGLAIPYAIENRIKKGDSYLLIMGHILLRSASLLVMGIFTVNLPSLNVDSTGMSYRLFVFLMVLGFFFVWNDYRKGEGWKKWAILVVQLLGAALLIFLAIRFRSGDDQYNHMTIQWWGILGLIGWTYLFSALIYLLSKGKIIWLIVGWLFFVMFNISCHAGWFSSICSSLYIPGDGVYEIFSFIGILVSVFYIKTDLNRKKQLPLIYFSCGTIFIALSLLLHEFFIISKIMGTPTWGFLCTGIALIVFSLIVYLVDLKDKRDWFDVIKPAGTATLTCYMIPYIVSFQMHGFFAEGFWGILKSVLYTFFIVGITWLIGKFGIKLKL